MGGADWRGQIEVGSRGRLVGYEGLYQTERGGGTAASCYLGGILPLSREARAGASGMGRK